MGPELPVIRVFVVDEQEVTRRGVAAVLEGNARISVVGEARSEREALARGPAARPDVAVVGVRSAPGSSAFVCERLRALVPGARVLALSSRADPETVHWALRAGASGYLLESVRGAELVAAVGRVASGGHAFDGETAAALRRSPGGRRRDELARLTPRERTVLELIGHGLSNRQIAGTLGLAEKTVKNYTSELLAKLHLDNRTQAAVLATHLWPGDREAGAVSWCG